MKKGFWLLAAVAAAAIAIGYGLKGTHKTSNAAVAALLPSETILLLHLPDFNQVQDDWHRSDVYRLYSDPAVQDFLRQPMTRPARSNSFAEIVQQLEKLALKDGFVALTSAPDNNPKIVAGFRYQGRREDAEQIIGRWRTKLEKGSGAARETVEYEQHKIDLATSGASVLAVTHAGDWLLAATDVAELKALLDRVDGRAKDPKALLSADENFKEAMAKMPSNYALSVYVQPKSFVEKLASVRATLQQPPNPDQERLLQQIRCVAATTRFTNGKMHDVLFVGMPRQPPAGDLGRSSLALATRDTFFYAVSLLNISRQFDGMDSAPTANILGGTLQKVARALQAAGLSGPEWDATFGSEFGLLANWPQNSHWPTVLVSCPVKDVVRAKKAALGLARNLDHDSAWAETEKDGVLYVSTPYAAGILALRPTIAVSERVMIAGADLGAVEAAMKNSKGRGELSGLDVYQRAERALPKPGNFYAYLDLAQLYTRLDNTLRPMLLMGAAFMPWTSDYVDLSKLPESAAVTKYLSPIVSSQRYAGNGYVAESMGPLTLNQAGAGAIVAAIGVGAWGKRSGMFPSGPLPSFSPGTAGTPSPSGGWQGHGIRVPSGSPSPSATP